jgi:hypothetical protein
MDTNTPTRSRDRLSEAKRLLLEKRIKGQVKPAAPRNGIRRVGGGPLYPMSFAQERLWFMDQVEPGKAFYNIPTAVLVSARLDIPVLEQAFTAILRRHEALRTVFQLVDGEPRQIVQPPYPFKVEMMDIRGPNGEPAQEHEIRETIARVGALPFDLATGPLVRVHLVRVNEADYALILNVHHIVTDGWSMPIITREMDEYYEAISRGLPDPRPRLDVQYPDYSVWQRCSGSWTTGAITWPARPRWTCPATVRARPCSPTAAACTASSGRRGSPSASAPWRWRPARP